MMNQAELTKRSIARFGLILVDPETGLTVDEETQIRSMSNTPRSIYMFEGLTLTGNEAYELQKRSVNGELNVIPYPTNLDYGKIFKLTDKATEDYCFVFSDEGEQFSKPHSDLNTAIESFKSYAESL